MSVLKQNFEKIKDDINDIKIAIVKIEQNIETNNDILDKLTITVEEHVRRSNAIESMVLLDKQALENKKDSDKLIWAVLCAVGVIFLAFKQLGILDKLF